MPSTQIRGELTGETEKRASHAIQPCEAGKSGKTSAEIKQMTKITISAAVCPVPKATILSGLYEFEFMAPSRNWLDFFSVLSSLIFDACQLMLIGAVLGEPK
jgi:hypothetical protein